MALNIKNPRAHDLARRLAQLTGERLTEAVIVSLEERLQRIQGRRAGADEADDILDIGRRCAALPDIDERTADDILGYGPEGTF